MNEINAEKPIQLISFDANKSNIFLTSELQVNL